MVVTVGVTHSTQIVLPRQWSVLCFAKNALWAVVVVVSTIAQAQLLVHTVYTGGDHTPEVLSNVFGANGTLVPVKSVCRGR